MPNNYVRDTVKLLQSLGFIVHTGKSVLEPTRRIQYLGFITDSQSMTVMLTPEKQADVIACCSKAEKKYLTIRDIAKSLGKLLHLFRQLCTDLCTIANLKKEKKIALVLDKGDFDGRMTLSLSAKSALLCGWIENTEIACNMSSTKLSPT